MEQHTALSRRDTCVDMIGKSLASVSMDGLFCSINASLLPFCIVPMLRQGGWLTCHLFGSLIFIYLQSEKLKISHCYVMRDKSLRRKIDGDSSARVNSNKIINYDEYYSDEEEEQWDDGGYNVRRWI